MWKRDKEDKWEAICRSICEKVGSGKGGGEKIALCEYRRKPEITNCMEESYLVERESDAWSTEGGIILKRSFYT